MSASDWTTAGPKKKKSVNKILDSNKYLDNKHLDDQPSNDQPKSKTTDFNFLKGENYIGWYQRIIVPKWSKKKPKLNKLFEDLLQKQGNKCAITGAEFVMDKPYDSQAPYLRHNKHKPWLPEYELVCWAFRPIKLEYDMFAVSGVQRKRGLIIDDDDYY